MKNYDESVIQAIEKARDEKILIPENVPYELIMLSEKEFSEITNQKVSTARANRLKGQGCIFYKIGGSVRYKLSDIIEYLNQCKRSSTTSL